MASSDQSRDATHADTTISRPHNAIKVEDHHHLHSLTSEPLIVLSLFLLMQPSADLA